MKFKKLIIVTISLFLILEQSISVLANQNNNLMEPYIISMEQFNEKYGTHYQFLSTQNLSETEKQNMIEYYSNMTKIEFDNHIKDIYEKDILLSKEIQQDFVQQDNIFLPRSSTFQNVQKYHYSGSNFLRITTNIRYIGGEYIYDKLISYGGSKNYPYYDPSIGFDSSISGDRKNIDCTFKCTKYLSKYIIDSNHYTLHAKFKAGGGDIYSTVTI